MSEQAVGAQRKQLPRFDGDPLNAKQWLDDFEKISSGNASEERDKVKSAASCFTNFALEWFINRDEAFQSWKELKEEFLVRFLRPEALQADAKVKLRRLIQDEKTDFCAHLIEVLRLCNIADPRMSENEQISWFMKSVRADYRPALVLAGIHSVNSLRDKCAIIDTIEPFRNDQGTKSRAPNVSRGPSSFDPKLTFQTKEVTKSGEPLANFAGGDNRPRRPVRPYCGHCARYGHTIRQCHFLRR